MLVVTICFPTVYGDGGIIGPPQIYIQEKAQNAIVAWNCVEEVLILSVDIESSESTKVLRVIPLPSNPIEVKEGSFESFTKLQDIINEKLIDLWGRSYTLDGDKDNAGTAPSTVEITFHDVLGAHNITVVKILDVTNFSIWATDFASSAGLINITFSSQFQDMVEEYIENNISYFVFDIIDTSEDEYSINPIVYRFETDFLFFPLKITAASDVGETYAHVNVFCIAKDRIKKEIFTNISFYSNLGRYSFYDYYFSNINLTEEELLEISDDIYDIFKDDPILMSYRYTGQYTDLEGDIIAYESDFVYPDVEISAEDILIERGTKNILNITVNNTGNTELEIILDIAGGIEWLQHEWYSIEPNYWQTLSEDDETTFEIEFDIPNNIPLGDYDLNYIVRTSEYGIEKQRNVSLTLYEKTEGGSGLYKIIGDLRISADYLLIGIIICSILITVLLILLLIFVGMKKK